MALVTSQVDLQPAWAEQRFIEKLRSIREADHEHIAACGHPVHLRQESAREPQKADYRQHIPGRGATVAAGQRGGAKTRRRP